MTGTDNTHAAAFGSPAERYAVGRMSESEELEFETRLLGDPKLAAEVEAIQRMRHGFRLLRARGELPVPARTGSTRTLRYALAAAVVLCLFAAGALILTRPWLRAVAPPLLTSTLASVGTPSDITTRILLVHTRGEERPAEIRLGPESKVIALRILPAVPDESGAYPAVLERLDPEGAVVVATGVRAVSETSGYVELYLDARRLTAGTYRLSLRESSGAEQFLLSVVSGN